MVSPVYSNFNIQDNFRGMKRKSINQMFLNIPYQLGRIISYYTLNKMQNHELAILIFQWHVLIRGKHLD